MAELFQFTVPPAELIVRGTIMYWFLFALFRFALRRDQGSLGLADILIVVVVSDAAQNGMAGEYKSIADAFVLVGTLGAWNRWFDWMAYRFPWFARFTAPPPKVLVQDGQILHNNLRRQMITKEELASHLREKRHRRCGAKCVAHAGA
ncbi:MAG: YetF domain-containing protein [Acidobacteriota bacterium]